MLRTLPRPAVTVQRNGSPCGTRIGGVLQGDLADQVDLAPGAGPIGVMVVEDEDESITGG